MITPASLALATILAQDTARTIPVFPKPAQTAQIAGLEFEVKSSTRLGAYLPKSASGDVWKAIAEQSSAPTPQPRPKVRVAVVLILDCLTIARNKNNYAADRTGELGPNREALDLALGQFETILKASKLDPQITKMVDDEILVVNDVATAEQAYGSVVAPLINDEPFASDDPVYRGPFDSVIVLTTAPLDRIIHTSLDQTPISILPISRLSPETYDVDLAAYMLAATKWHLQSGPIATRPNLNSPLTTAGVTPAPDETIAVPINPWGRTQAPPIQPLDPTSPLQRQPIDTTLTLLPDGSAALTGMGIALLTSTENQPALASATRHLDSHGRTWIVIPNAAKNFQSLFAPATAGTPEPILTGELPISPRSFGAFIPTIRPAALKPEPNNFTQIGTLNRGGIELLRHRITPIVADPANTHLKFGLNFNTQDPLALNFYGGGGEYLGSIQIAGDRQPQTVSAHRSNHDGKAEMITTISLAPIKAPIFRIVLGPPPGSIPSTRLSRENRELILGKFELLKGNIQASEDIKTPLDLFDRNAPNAELIKLASSANNRVIIAAAGALTDQPTAEMIPVFATLARSASSADAFLGSKGLSLLQTPEAVAELRATLKIGPFDHNRRFAAQAMKGPLDETYIDQIALLLTSRAWATRLQGARLLSLIPGDKSQTYAVSSLFDPIPNVRLGIVQMLNPDSALSARRLEFLAVNDSSEDIRAASYLRLLAAKDEPTIAAGRRGTRDESRLVRMTILQAITAKPDEANRSTLRQVVLDKDPALQAIALRAFAQLPKEVVIEEVANCIGHNAVIVQLALLQLAETKKLAIPTAELERLSASPDSAVSTLAKKLRGGQ
jgi:HEAT repeat protein